MSFFIMHKPTFATDIHPMRIFKRLLLALLVLFLIGYVFISYSLSNRVLTPNSSLERTLGYIGEEWMDLYNATYSKLPAPEAFTVEGFENAQIRGQYFNVSDSSQCLFIFAHGWTAVWSDMLKYYPVIEKCGCDALFYDHRAHGESGGEYPTGGLKEAEDLIKITQWASDQKGYSWDQIGWIGSSWGAATVLIAGAKEQNPAFIIADSPFQDWYSAIFERAIVDYGSGIKFIAPGVLQFVNARSGVDYRDASPMNIVSKVEEPIFLFHSEVDPETHSNQSINIAKNLNDLSEFHLTKWGNKHVRDVIYNKEEIENLISKFIAKNELYYFQPRVAADSLAN